MSSPNDQNPHQTPTRNTQSLNWIQMQSEMPLHSPSPQGFFHSPSPPPTQGFYPNAPPPQGFYPNQTPPQGFYPTPPPNQGFYISQPQNFHPQQSFTELLTQNEGLETINPSLSQPHSPPSQVPSEDTSNKRKEKGKGKAKSRDWSINECENLAKSWIHVSVDAVVGRGQHLKDFWNRVTKEFNVRMDKGPDYRPKDQVYSKYKKMNPDVAYFNDTFLSIEKSKSSGWNEAKILQRVNKTFFQERGKPFPYHTVWEIVRHNQKWKADCKKNKGDDSEDDDDQSQPTKKSRTSGSDYSDAHIGFNLNEFAAPSPPEEPQEPRQPRARPTGRDKSKAQARAKGKAKEAPPELVDKVDKINEKLGMLLEKEDKKLEQRDLRMLFLDTSHMSGRELEAVEKVKARIRAKYNLD